jgi:thioredoxin reductase
MNTHDVAIIGGGPAGLSAALVLARARRRVILFDAGTPRNSRSPGVYGFPSRDGVSPATFKTMVRSELANYGGVEIVASEVRRLESYQRGRYIVEDDSGRVARAGTVILAIGMVDVLPRWTGLDKLWGKDVMHCAHCHGWERRGLHWGVVASSLSTVASAHQYRCWTDRVTVFVDPGLEIPAAALSRLGEANIDIARCRIRDLVLSGDGQLGGIRTDNGDELPCEALIYSPPQRAPGLVQSMRITTHSSNRVVVDERNETSLGGVFAVGDITPGPQNVLAAATQGATVARNIIPAIAPRPTPARAWFDRAQEEAREALPSTAVCDDTAVNSMQPDWSTDL